MTYSSSGVGSAGQLFAESLAQKFGLKIEHVPYKGASQGLMDVVGGHIAFAAQTLTSTAGQIRGGTLRPIMVSAPERIADFPEIPTLKELGYDELTTSVWFSLSGPAHLPESIVQKINREVVTIMAKPEMRQRMQQEGMVTQALTPEERERRH